MNYPMSGCAMSRPWIKIHIECLDNPKVATLSLSLRGIWFTTLLIAERFDKAGLLPSSDRFALMAHADEETIEKAFAALLKKGLIEETPDGLRVHDWADWQARKPSDEPERIRERVAKSRSSKASDDVTPRNAIQNDTKDVTPRNARNAVRGGESETESKREREIEKEKRQPTVAQEAQRAMFAALADVFGRPTPGEEHGRYEKAARALITAGVEPSEIPRLRQAWDWLYTVPPSVNSFAGKLTALRQAQPRPSSNGKHPTPIRTETPPLDSRWSDITFEAGRWTPGKEVPHFDEVADRAIEALGGWQQFVFDGCKRDAFERVYRGIPA